MSTDQPHAPPAPEQRELIACCLEHRVEFVRECPRCRMRRDMRRRMAYDRFVHGPLAGRMVHTFKDGYRLW